MTDMFKLIIFSSFILLFTFPEAKCTKSVFVPEISWVVQTWLKPKTHSSAEATSFESKARKKSVCHYLDFQIRGWHPCSHMCPICMKFGKHAKKCRENDCYCCDYYQQSATNGRRGFEVSSGQIH